MLLTNRSLFIVQWFIYLVYNTYMKEVKHFRLLYFVLLMS